jgi:hypothetical protein
MKADKRYTNIYDDSDRVSLCLDHDSIYLATDKEYKVSTFRNDSLRPECDVCEAVSGINSWSPTALIRAINGE